MTITIAVSEQDKRLLEASIAGYRTANAEIDNAVQSENWHAIDDAQNTRSLHANTIALIINKHTNSATQKGART